VKLDFLPCREVNGVRNIRPLHERGFPNVCADVDGYTVWGGTTFSLTGPVHTQIGYFPNKGHALLPQVKQTIQKIPDFAVQSTRHSSVDG
jgi:hypothetical protein